jgi:selenocysteine lyase/cysteine desulfurase
VRAPRGWPEGLRQALASENVYASLRVNTLRISPHLFATEDDVTQLFRALDRLGLSLF